MAWRDDGLRRAVLTVALANLGYFGVEFAVALSIGSASLLADSADFLEDASVNLLIFFAIAWSARSRTRVGMAMAFILLAPALAFLWTAWQKFQSPVPPEPVLLSLTGNAIYWALSLVSWLLLRRWHESALPREE